MKISNAEEFKVALLKMIAEREFSVREGTHCSDLLYCLNKQALRRRFGDESTEHEILLFSLGWATQRWLTGKVKDEDTIVKEGISVTCDSNAQYILPLNRFIPWELKCTFQSSGKDVMENTAWLKQIMAQCYVQDTNVAYLSRFELMGNWKSIFGKKEEKGFTENEKPTLHCFKLEFTEEDLRRNWQWLKDRKILFEELLKGGRLLPKAIAIPSGQEYECQYCKFKDKECIV